MLPDNSPSSPESASSSPAAQAPERAPEAHVPETGPSLSRRGLLSSGLGAAALAGAGVVLPAITGGSSAQAQLPPNERRAIAFRKRGFTAIANRQMPLASHPDNGDETLYPDKLGSYSKGLPHNAFGEVDPLAYSMFFAACDGESFGGFDAIPSGEPNAALRRKLVNPMAGKAYDLEGRDSHDFTQPPAPAFASAEEAGEIVENYWMALLRDIPFNQYGAHPLAAAACADLSALSDFRGPKVAGQVTPQTLFRVDFPGVLDGPYLSQFFWKSQPFGAQQIDRHMETPIAGLDYMKAAAEWLAIQNGRVPAASLVMDPVLRYMRNGRDLGQWVHIDALHQAYFQAALNLLTPAALGGSECPFNPGNPYAGTVMQEGFGTFGGPHVLTIVSEVATRALKSVWYQKWFVHRRLRPEAFAGRVHHKLASGRPYPIHADVLNSAALAQTFSQNGTYLLPMAFPEGSPLHPAYGAGHATVAGACVTILKAIFDGNHVVPNPIVPTNDGLQFNRYVGSPLTVEGELNKIAVNVAFGRNVAGVHWRTDGTESLLLGEAVAISILRDQRTTYVEPFGGFTFRKFDGTTVTV